ncbi:restriction endonuclease subunit S [Leifsonia sp. NPDC014704]|uniref:restriction endonuclease subunit S n=1 Tax=Leifsonia sp. NPDC014704 TaxID=3364123 RepID=UPI0036F496C8
MKTLPLKAMVDPRRPLTYGIVQAGDDVPNGVPYIRPVDMDGHKGVSVESLQRTDPAIAASYKRSALKSGDLVVSIGPSYGKTMVVPPELIGANLTQGTARVAVADEFSSTFVRWALQSAEVTAFWDAASGGSTFRALNLGPLGQTPIPVHSPEKQSAIADFLDRETARTDAFISKNEELVALLNERRAAVIARAILRGVDDKAQLRDSGIAWIGRIPEHWQVSKLSRWFGVTLGKMLDEAKFANTFGDVLPYVRASNIKSERLDLADVKSMPFTRSEQSKFSLRAGDLLVVEGGSIGVNAPVDTDMPGWGFQKTVNRVRSLRGDLTRYLGFQLDVLRAAGVLDMSTNVSTIQHLTAEKLERLIIAMPPREEQAQIVRHVALSIDQIDRAISTTGDAIRLARERRAAMISAAVTGKIDVGVVVA